MYTSVKCIHNCIHRYNFLYNFCPISSIIYWIPLLSGYISIQNHINSCTILTSMDMNGYTYITHTYTYVHIPAHIYPCKNTFIPV